MSGDASNTNGDDVVALWEEIFEVKGILRELSQQMLRIERRVKAVFPPPSTVVGARRARGPSARIVVDEQAATRIVDELREQASRGEQIESRLRGLTVKPELTAIARVLGMTNSKLPPKDELVRRLSSRLRQSAAVAAGIAG